MVWRTNDGSYESWIDKQIRDAEERGEFDDLPGKGKPLAKSSRPDDPDWWIKQKVAEENLDLSAAMPLPLQLRKEGQRLPERILDERTESAARAVLDDFNERVRLSWTQTYDGLSIHAKLADADELVQHWRDHHARPAAEASPPATSEPGRRQSPGLLRRALLRLARKPTWRA